MRHLDLVTEAGEGDDMTAAGTDNHRSTPRRAAASTSTNSPGIPGTGARTTRTNSHGSESRATSTAPRDRRQRRTARTRADIEDAALRLFRDQGFDATTVEQIAEAADVATRTFFRHFPHKEAVLFGDPAHETERMRVALDSRPTDEHPMRSMVIAMLDSAERMEADRAQHLMRAELLNALTDAGDYELHLMRQRWVRETTTLVAERLGTIDASDPRPAAWSMTLISCFGAAMRAWLVRADGTSLRTLLGEILTNTASGFTIVSDLINT